MNRSLIWVVFLIFLPDTLLAQSESDTFMRPPEPAEFQNPILPAPDWLRNAVIAEIPIRPSIIQIIKVRQPGVMNLVLDPI